MFLLDTHVVSELRKAGDSKANRRVTDWFSDKDSGTFFISVITLMELETGVLRVERRDPSQGKRLRQWLDTRVRSQFAERCLAVDTQVAIRRARLHSADPRSERDALIAATALVQRLTVVTRHTKDFGPTGVKLINPWAGPQ